MISWSHPENTTDCRRLCSLELSKGVIEMKKFRRGLTALLCVLMLFSSFGLPISAAAEEPDPETSAEPCEHDWSGWVEVDGHSECPAVKGRQIVCKNCGETRGIAEGTHTWSAWEGSGTACEGYAQSRHCTGNGCDAVETRTITASGHKWVAKTIAATCTQTGSSWEQCSVCGAMQNETSIPATGHRARSDDGDCTTPVYCVTCGEIAIPAISHNYSSDWSYDNVSHWHTCTNPGCTARSQVVGHNGSLSNDCTRLSSCSVCGIKSSSSGLSHNFDGTVYTMVSSSGHSVRCSNPGCHIALDTVPHVAAPGSGQSCTEAVRCVCGYTMVPAKNNHTYGPWVGSASGHSRSCARCGYVESAVHTTGANDGSCTTALVCSVCSYVLEQAYASHAYGVWHVNSTNTGHTRVCTHYGCSISQNEAHSGGMATCSSPAVCYVCGAAYGTVSSSNHTGGTEIRDAKPAQIGVAGYTGDTYCLGCGKQLTKGSSIPALEAGHIHSYGDTWASDSASHWHMCACGERSAEAAHSFSNGSCSVCGAADPNYKTCGNGSHIGGTELRDVRPAQIGVAGYTGDTYCLGCGELLSRGRTIQALVPEHTHSYGDAWRSDSGSHWRECVCGGRGYEAAHRFSRGNCSVCGAADPNYKVCSGSNHIGGTEIRDAKPAQIGVAGYTGDTYCLGCGKRLAKGSAIPALEAGHTHSYGTAWAGDGGRHWHECACGARSAEAAHSFSDGKCSVCGAADPNYEVCSGSSHVGGTEIRDSKPAQIGVAGYTGDTYCLGCGKLLTKGSSIPALAAEHTHVYSATWAGDSSRHWHECACGERGSLDAHSYADGKCTVCGAMDWESENAHVHSFGPWITSGRDHWRECTVCSEQADRAAHVMLNGKCVECGMIRVEVSIYQDISSDDVYYDAVKKVVEHGIFDGESRTAFKPETPVSRSLAADMLYRLAGTPVSLVNTDFEDVSADASYAKAVNWAYANHYMEASGAVFEPERIVTLQELITFLWRYAQEAEYAVPGDVSKLSDYIDPAEVEPWAAEAMVWAYESGILEGLDGDDLIPVSNVTKATAAVIAAHFIDLVEELEQDTMA